VDANLLLARSSARDVTTIGEEYLAASVEPLALMREDIVHNTLPNDNRRDYGKNHALHMNLPKDLILLYSIK
jgi:hypothetical protein